MNILIIGEFSGFARHLKHGFKKLGHQVTIVQNGDGWKQIKGDESDIFYAKGYKIGRFVVPGSGRLSAIFIRRKILDKLNALFVSGVDLIIVISYRFLSNSLFQAGVPIKYIEEHLRTNTKLIMSVCGTDPAGKYANPSYYRLIESEIPLRDSRFDFLINNSHAIIPTGYEYFYAIKRYCIMRGFGVEKISNSVPLPITVNPSYSIKTCFNRKIVIFHGIIRPVAKGSNFIMEAMNLIQKDYPEKVVCISKGGMPYDEYVKVFDSVDILIDQTYINGWGINAIIGAMEGKCVLTSCGKENQENMGISSIPFIQIGPNSEEIYNVLKELVLDPAKIDMLKMKSRSFAVKYCSSDIVANKYLQLVNC